MKTITDIDNKSRKDCSLSSCECREKLILQEEEIENYQHTLQEKEQLLFQSDQQLQEKDQQLFEQYQLIEGLKFHLALALQQRFCSRSEKNTQAGLFDEADDTANNANIEDEDNNDIDVNAEEETHVDETDEKIIVASHVRKKPGKKPLPKNLPRVRKEYDLTDEEKICSCGKLLTCIGEEKSEQLDIIPAQMFVIEHARKKYACKHCEETIKTATKPPQAIPKSIAAPGLLAHILVCKYCDHLPLYRQEKILQRIGVDLSRATMCSWVIKCAHLFLPLIKLMKDNVIHYDAGYADETTLQVLKEPDRKPTSRSTMWLFGGGPPEKFCWIYEYHPSRKAEVALQFFEDFEGYVHVDGYGGYEPLEKSNVKLVGCFAHARRKFVDIIKTAKKKTGLAKQAVLHIRKLYALEEKMKENRLGPDEIKQIRQTRSKPLLDEFKQWLDQHISKVPPKSPIAKAISYTIKQWDKLIRYIEDGRLEIDNNRTERAIKPFVMGRKNWLFSDNVKGAEASSVIYSLIETCKEHRIEPYAYLRFILTNLPFCETVDELEKLLPFNCDRDLINSQWRVSKETPFLS